MNRSELIKQYKNVALYFPLVSSQQMNLTKIASLVALNTLLDSKFKKLKIRDELNRPFFEKLYSLYATVVK